MTEGNSDGQAPSKENMFPDLDDTRRVLGLDRKTEATEVWQDSVRSYHAIMTIRKAFYTDGKHRATELGNIKTAVETLISRTISDSAFVCGLRFCGLLKKGLLPKTIKFPPIGQLSQLQESWNAQVAAIDTEIQEEIQHNSQRGW